MIGIALCNWIKGATCQSLDELEKELLDRFGLRLENLVIPGSTESPL